MICTRCSKKISSGQKYHRTKKGPHHEIGGCCPNCIGDTSICPNCGRGPKSNDQRYPLSDGNAAIIVGRLPNGNRFGYVEACSLPTAWTDEGKNVSGMTAYDLTSISESAAATDFRDTTK